VKTLSRYVSRAARGRGRSPQHLVVIAYKAAADVVSKTVTLIVTIAAARVLAPDEFGALALAMTTGWLLSVASDAGLPLDLARQMAQEASGGTPPRFVHVRDALVARLGLAAVATVIALAVGIVLVPLTLVPSFVVIAVALVANASLETLGHAFRGLGRSDIEASLSLAQRLAAGLAAGLVLAFAPTLLGVACALAIPPAVALVVGIGLVRRMTAAGGGDGSGGRPLSARFLREVAPLGVAVLLSAIYFRCDVYFVERWHGLDTVGLYNAAFRIVEALRLIPAAVMAVMFPVFCTTRTWQPARSVLTVLVPISVIGAAAIALTAPAILELAYGSRFAIAAPALALLAAALPFFFANYVLTHQVIAWDGQRAYLGVTAAALATNLAANALLIPAGGMRGAALATLLTEVVVSAGCVWALVGRGSATAVAAVAIDDRALSGDSL
jgi:O-antigen/teichoic acid export membrane protein